MVLRWFCQKSLPFTAKINAPPQLHSLSPSPCAGQERFLSAPIFGLWLWSLMPKTGEQEKSV
jgi:hypothetical protein